MKKELRGWDRVQALIRNPEYKNEYNEFSKLKEFKDQNYFQKRENLLKKWRLNFPINPEEYRNKSKPKYAIEFSNNSYNDYPAKPLPFKQDSENTYWLRDKRYLKIEVDLTFPIDKIKDDVVAIVKDWKSNIIDKGRNKPTSYSPWEIYDMVNAEGSNRAKVARKLYGKTPKGQNKNLSYNEYLMAYYKQVQRAYIKALQMIDQVKKDTKFKQ